MKSKLLFPLLAALAIFLVFANCSDSKTTPPGCTEEEGCEVGGGSSSSNGNAGGIGAHATLAENKDANKSKIQEMYNTWINTYYVEYENDTQKGSSPNANAGGTARIKAAFNNVNDGSRTCSEAIGYGMILTSLMGDWEKFDKLHRYSKLYHYNDMKLMRWNVLGFSGGTGGAATDADIDIMASLIIAYKKTGENRYLNDAKEIGTSLYDYAIGDTKLLLPAVKTESWINDGKGGKFLNISYMSLAAIKALADEDPKWNEVLEASISYMQNVQNGGDGLWPDWSDVNGAPINPCNGSNDCLENGSLTERGRCSVNNRECDAGLNSYEAYYKETPRIPWRIAWYYHWYGDTRAQAMLNRGMGFLQNKGINSSNFATNTKHFYSYQNNKEGTRTKSIIYLSLCALGMGSSANQDWVNSCSDKAITIYDTNIPALSSYYDSSLQLIYAMLFNGVF
jgi:hypothetical protein